MPLPGLPLDLRCLVLECMSTEDLYSTVTSSAEYFRTFNLNRRSILKRIFQRDLHSDTLRHFLAVVRLPKVSVHNHATDDPAYANLWNYFEAYRERTSTAFTEFPTDVGELVALAQLDILVSRLTYRYYNGTMAVLHHQGEKPDLELQFTQDTRQEAEIPVVVKARIKRAFTRLELYTRCFPTHTGRLIEGPCHLVFGLLQDWETEEIRTVYFYMKNKLDNMIMRMNRSLIIDVKSQAVTANSTIRKRKRGRENDFLYSLSKFSGAELDGLLIYGSNYNDRLRDRLIEYTSAPLIHLGLRYMEQLFDTRGLEWMDILRRDVGSLHPRYNILNEWLLWPGSISRRYERDEPIDEENVNGPEFGYEAFYNTHDRYRRYMETVGIVTSITLRLGFPFWKKKALDQDALRFAVAHGSHLRNADPSYFRDPQMGRIPAEDALDGVEITRESLEAIRAKYGFSSEPFKLDWKERLRKSRRRWEAQRFFSTPYQREIPTLIITPSLTELREIFT